MRVIVGVTGASGSLYAAQLIGRLVANPEVEEVALIVTDNGAAVCEHEGITLPVSSKIRRADNHSMFDAVASGSAAYDAMAIIPCSMGTLGRIASGVSMDLVGRAADVMLKERRRVVICPRETPLSLIHIQNMERLTLAGAVILPCSPSLYSHPQTIDEMCATVVERVVAQMGIREPHYEWSGK